MTEEELVFQLLDEDRKVRTERIVEERKITVDDCLVLGITRLNRGMGELRKEVAGMNNRIDEIKESRNNRIDETNERMEETKESLSGRIDKLNTRIEGNFRWTTGIILIRNLAK